MELLRRSDGIGPKRRFVNVRVISRHLACVGVRALRVGQLEVCEHSRCLADLRRSPGGQPTDGNMSHSAKWRRSRDNLNCAEG